MNNIKLLILLPLAMLMGGVISCSDAKGEQPTAFDVSFILPGSVDAVDGGTFDLQVNDGKAPNRTDLIILTANSGVSYPATIENVSADFFTVRIQSGLSSGDYSVYLKRGDRKKSFGSFYLNIIKNQLDIDLDKNTTVYGQVRCGDNPLKGVVISDGVEVTVTDEQGVYQIPSKKKWGYVFVSVPSGYEVKADGILPQFHYYLKSDASAVERADFELSKAPKSQDKYKMFFLGDMHLANRTNDRVQFNAFTDDFNKYMRDHKAENMYAMTLGDMTWDIYWYSKGYEFPQYLEEINSKVSGIQIFHTMGNHDNDYKTKNDFDAAFKYVRDIAPTYYSFNIGKIHYIVLDDIDCSAYDGTESRNYTKDISQEQLDWLRKDLSYVSKDTPLIITTHAQIFYPWSTVMFNIDHAAANTKELFSIVNGYKVVHFVTGHTHTIFNANPSDTQRHGAENVYEHNAGSICASWWWSGYLTPGVWVSLDGAPAGYSIWDIDGTDIKWKYKSTGWDESYQFRSYDLNKVSFSYSDVPDMPSSLANKFKKYVDAYPGSSNNEVLINIWNWNSNWTLTVTDETGKQLEYTRMVAYDPLHIAALSVKRFNDKGLKSEPNFITENKMPHFFKVKADNADVDLTIKVTDEFGNTWTENMARPKVFKVSDYAK